MNNKQAYDQFYRGFIISQREQSQEDFPSLLLMNHQNIVYDFEATLLEAISQAYQFQQKECTHILYSCECAILISAMFSDSPFIITEIFGQGWYNDILTQSRGMCSTFFAYWSKLREDAKKEAR